MGRSLLVVMMLLVGAGCGVTGDGHCGSTPPGCTWSECALDARDATCGGEVYRCEDGDWVPDGFCDPGFLHISGDLTMTVGVGDSSTTGCASLVARDPLVITGAGDDQFTATAPTTVIEASTDTTSRPATGVFMLTDEWTADGAPAIVDAIELDLTFDDDGVIGGGGGATIGDCGYDLEVSGTYEPDWRIGG